MRFSPKAVLPIAIVCLAGITARAQTDPDADLASVRSRIASLVGKIQQQTRQRDDGAAELERIERDAAKAEAAVRGLDGQVAAEERREAALEAEAATVGGRLVDERSLLAEQVRLSYRSGQQEALKLLLSQENPAALGRMLTYYDYLNRARTRRIEAASSELRDLERVGAESRATRDALARLRDQRAGELAGLAAARADRAALIERLDAAIAASGDEVDRLKAEEARLADLVVELAELLEGFPSESEAPFSDWRGRLSWPIEGKLAEDFGDLREGGPLRWNGVVLEAPAGTPVRAVYHGRVAFADWLPGLGLLLILDHGENYMSLYGHNQTLLREPGDWVEPGESIALVGDTGGRQAPALYFEIRRNGEPVNPHDWIH